MNTSQMPSQRSLALKNEKEENEWEQNNLCDNIEEMANLRREVQDQKIRNVELRQRHESELNSLNGLVEELRGQNRRLHEDLSSQIKSGLNGDQKKNLDLHEV